MTQKPTKVRWLVLAFIFVVGTLTYLDRVNMSVAGKYIMAEYGIDSVSMGYVFSAFVFGYACLQVPAGWLGDKFGPRKVVAFAVVWWSIFTIFTAYAGDWAFLREPLGVVGAFITIRFLIGVGEAAAYPNFNKTIANWMHPTDRAFAGGIMNATVGIGSAIAPPLIAWIMIEYGWREAFWICGLTGFVLAVIWYWFITDHPELHNMVNAAEVDYIRAGEATGVEKQTGGSSTGSAWKKILASRDVWLLVLGYVFNVYVIYVYVAWFYLYLVNVKGFGLLSGAMYSTLPFIAIAIMSPLGGYISDRLIGRLSLRMARRVVIIPGLLLCSACIFLGAQAADSITAIALLSFGAGFLYFGIGAFWGTCTDLAKEHTGTVSGMMNTGGNIGGTISPVLTPLIAKTYGWDYAIQAAALCAFIVAIIWCFINPERKIDFCENK